MVFLLTEIMSSILIVLSFALLILVLLKHFKGMQYPPYWIYFIGGFVLLSLQNVFENIAPATDLAESVNETLKLVSSLSIFLGSYEIYKTYDSNVSKKVADRLKQN